MILLNNFVFLLNNFFLIYAIALFSVYVFIAVFSSLELRFYMNKNKHIDYKSMLGFERLPSVSIIAPAYNEHQSIVENIRCLLSIYYPKLEVIIVNDGSTDNSMELIIKHFDLVKVDLAVELRIPCAEIRGIYKSRNSAYENLVVVDKANGGKSDALNAGINVSQGRLFLAVDVDCIIEPDAILRMVKPFLEEENGKVVIASGGVVRIANSCEVTDGRVVKVLFPKQFWAKFQVLEYFRAFILGRMAWSKINGLLIISGAFGMFDKQRVINVGGYDITTVGEDLELVVRMRKYMHNVEKRKYKVAFIPDPLCWTEVPSSLKTLGTQRTRWTRGAIDTIAKHKNIFMNPRYGRMGMISFPYWVFFEWLAPMVEAAGLIYFTVLMILGMVNLKTFAVLLLFVYTFSVMFSVFAIFYESYTYNKYKGTRYLASILFVAFTEILLYHPLIMWFALKGNFEYFFRKNKKGWGVMKRTSFDAKKK